MTATLAVDLGGTKLRAALFRGDVAALQVLAQEGSPADREGFVRRLTTLAHEGGVDAIGVAVPGLVDGTTCRWIPNLPYLDGLDLEAEFPDLRVALGNDAQIALLAEAKAGAALGMSDAILLSIGTGIGSAVLANGAIVAGAHGGACSFGWASGDPSDAGDPRSGWLERVASGRALDAIAARLGMAGGAELIAAARRGNAAARAALEPPCQHLGMALAGAVSMLDPQAIIVAGGIAEALDVLGPPILASLRPRLPAHLNGIGLRPGVFGSRAALVGAALAGAAGAEWRRLQ